jgi:CheY-like chemotaxis protein
MELAPTIEALSKLAWPVLAAIAFWRIYPAIRRVLDSRAFTIKVGEFNLTVQEATERLSKDLEDVREKVSELRAEGAGAYTSLPAQASVIENVARKPLRPVLVPRPRRVLWVDDKPQQKAFYIDQIRSEGIDVVEVRSTKEAIEAISSNPGGIGLVISNVGRWEGDKFNHEAGIELTTAIRQTDASVPILMFTAKKKASRYSVPVNEAGADGITWSPLELFEMLHHFIPSVSAETK